MKFAILTAAAFLALSATALADEGALPAKPTQVCLQASMIDHTTVISDREILFTMKDHKVWKNTMRQSCPNLKFERGFSEVIRGGTICANMQSIRVLHDGNPCILGDFTPYMPPPKSDKP